MTEEKQETTKNLGDKEITPESNAEYILQLEKRISYLKRDTKRALDEIEEIRNMINYSNSDLETQDNAMDDKLDMLIRKFDYIFNKYPFAKPASEPDIEEPSPEGA